MKTSEIKRLALTNIGIISLVNLLVSLIAQEPLARGFIAGYLLGIALVTGALFLAQTYQRRALEKIHRNNS